MVDEREKIVGRYALLELLGRGGAGQVWKCEDLQLRRIVAIKLLLGDSSPEHIARFQIEARAAAQLKHTNILQVHDFGRTDDGRAYLVMDYLKGESLHDILRREGRMTIEELAPILRGVCSGLSHAHSRGVLHRDVKPSNVMLVKDHSGEQVAKIVDFGVAEFVGSDETNRAANSSMTGTAAYMAPEVVQGEQVDERADIYSMGCMIFEALTGVRPYEGETAIETMMLHSKAPIPTLKEKGTTTYSSSLELFVSRFLQKEKEDRFDNMESVVSALDDMLENMRGTETHTRVSEDRVDRAFSFMSLKKLLLCFIAIGCFVSLGNWAYSRLFAPEDDSLVVPGLSTEEASEDLDNYYREEISVINTPKGRQLRGAQCDDGDLRTLAEKYPTIELWNLSNGYLKGFGFKYLKSVKIKHLNLRTNALEPGVLKELANLPTIEALNLEQNDVLTNDDIADLKNLPKLKNLSLSGNLPSGVEVVEKPKNNAFSNLVMMDVGPTAGAGPAGVKKNPLDKPELVAKINGGVCKQVGKLDTIETLALSAMALREEDVVQLRELEQLQKLELVDITFEGKAFSTLIGSTPVRTLKLIDCRIDSHDVAAGADFSRLNEVQLKRCSLSDVSLSAIINAPELRTLSLVMVSGISDKPFKDIQNAKNLRELRMLGIPISDSVMKSISHSSDLETLVISNLRFTGDLAANLNLPSLRHLSLNYSIVSAPGGAFIAKMKRLRSLSLVGSRIDKGALQKIAHSRSLVALSLQSAKFDHNELLKFQNNAQLQLLDLRSTRLDEPKIIQSLKRKRGGVRFVPLNEEPPRILRTLR